MTSGLRPPLPIRDDASAYCARHGWGYSRFEHEAHGVASDLLVFVPLADPIKISRLKLRNTTSRRRRLSVTAYVEWVLGVSRASSAAVRLDGDRSPDPARCSRVIRGTPRSGPGRLPRPGGTPDSAGRPIVGSSSAATAVSPTLPAWPPAPAFGAVGAGLDPCGVLQTVVELAPGERDRDRPLPRRRRRPQRGGGTDHAVSRRPISTRC